MPPLLLALWASDGMSFPVIPHFENPDFAPNWRQVLCSGSCVQYIYARVLLTYMCYMYAIEVRTCKHRCAGL